MRRSYKLAAVLVVASVAAWYGWRQYERYWLSRPIEALATPAAFEVAPGDSVRAVADSLHARGLLDRPGIWVRYAKRSGHTTRIKVGEYQLPARATPAGLLEQFVAGHVILHTLTLPEGWNIRQALAAIRSHPKVMVELAGLPEQEWMARLGLSGLHPEGQFFPDTYRFPRGTTDRELLAQAHAKLQQELQAAWRRRAPDLPLDSPYQVLILASLVEKETGAEDERPLIAGVFVNRLRKGMLLQTDPTVIYGIGDEFDGNLRRRDLRGDTPYNTYVRRGLPPTPIALAGRAALEAAVRPAETDALYFVATGKGDGRHFFAATLAAHNANVKRHLANLRAARRAALP
ncbi:MAG: endolytic transglycosylase MltG [Steroidobacteraceae bacterium]